MPGGGRARHAAALVEQLEPAARPRSGRTRRSRRARPSSARRGLDQRAARGHGATTTRSTFWVAVGARATSRRCHARRRAAGRLTSLHASRLLVLALHPHREALALEPCTNGSGKAPTIAGIAHRRLPVAVVPLDDVARRELALGRAHARTRCRSRRRTSRAAPRGPRAARGRRSTARSGRRSASRPRCVELQEAHHGVALAHAVDAASAASSSLAEVARDAQLDAALPLLARARGRSRPRPSDEREQGERTAPQRTVTRCGRSGRGPALAWHGRRSGPGRA